MKKHSYEYRGKSHDNRDLMLIIFIYQLRSENEVEKKKMAKQKPMYNKLWSTMKNGK